VLRDPSRCTFESVIARRITFHISSSVHGGVVGDPLERNTVDPPPTCPVLDARSSRRLLHEPVDGMLTAQRWLARVTTGARSRDVTARDPCRMATPGWTLGDREGGL
jgi:hypothetical protein